MSSKVDLSMNDYQEFSRATSVYPTIRISVGDGPLVEAPWLYPLLGLLGEAGELAEKYKKFVRDDHGVMTPARAEAIQGERGDVNWYLARLAEAGQSTLGADAHKNLEKLASRKARGVLGGSGDNR